MATKQTKNQASQSQALTQALSLSPSMFEDLKKAKSAMKADLENGGLHIGETFLELPSKIIHRAIVEGIYRLLSAETAKVPEVEKASTCVDILRRLARGYWSATEEKAATRPIVEKSSGKKAAFGRMEILGALRDLVEPGDKETEKKIAIVESYDDAKFSLFVAAQATKADSLVSKALTLLTEKAEAKAKAELDAVMADLVDL